MTWAAQLADLNAAVLDPAAFGELVTTPSGAQVYGVFTPVGPAAGGLYSDVGLHAPAAAQPNPMVSLMPTDAAGLTRGSLVSIRGTAYQVTRPPRPDNGGMMQVELMPAPPGAADTLARYR